MDGYHGAWGSGCPVWAETLVTLKSLQVTVPDDLGTCGFSALLGCSTGQAWGRSLGAHPPTPRSHASPEATGALPTLQNPRYRAPAREASVFPAPVARGVREQPPDAPRLWEGKGQGPGEYGAPGGRLQPGPCVPQRSAESGGRQRAWGAVRSAPASASPASEGGTGALRTQTARAPTGSSATASWTPGQPPPGAAAAPQRAGERTHRALVATGGAPDANPGLPRGCKVVGSPDWLAASSRFASGTGQVAGVWEEGAGSCRPPTWVPESGGQETAGMAAGHPPSSATPPSAPGGGALATGSALRTCPPHPALLSPPPPTHPGRIVAPCLTATLVPTGRWGLSLDAEAPAIS